MKFLLNFLSRFLNLSFIPSQPEHAHLRYIQWSNQGISIPIWLTFLCSGNPQDSPLPQSVTLWPPWNIQFQVLTITMQHGTTLQHITPILTATSYPLTSLSPAPIKTFQTPIGSPDWIQTQTILLSQSPSAEVIGISHQA